MADMLSALRQENRRLSVLRSIRGGGKLGYQISGEEPDWFEGMAVDLHHDGLVGCREVLGRKIWFLTDAGKRKLQS